MTTKAKLIFDDAFSKHRDPRSREYKAGVFDMLRRKFGEIPQCICPYDMGTAQADAWLSGTEEGRHLFNHQYKTE